MFSLKDAKNVADIRGYGLFAAIDVASDGAPDRVRGYSVTTALTLIVLPSSIPTMFALSPASFSSWSG